MRVIEGYVYKEDLKKLSKSSNGIVVFIKANKNSQVLRVTLYVHDDTQQNKKLALSWDND